MRRLAALLLAALPAAAQQAHDAPSRSLFPAPGLSCEEAASGFGSLIALALDPHGAPVVSVESGGLLRLYDDDADGRFERAENFCDELSACQGLCFTGETAWATGVGPKGPGLYHLPGADGPRAPHFVAAISGSIGEHGPHAVRLAPDGRLLVMLGNHVSLNALLENDSPLQFWYEGHIVPRMVDPGGHATDIHAPGGTLLSYDARDGSWRLIAAGFRNAYDFEFAPNGDIFTYDSDMEWDIGLPWYRPVRVVHVLPGGDYGWRTGSAKWPAWYPDSLPPALETGRGSPTGIAWCASPAFPPAFRDTLLLGDWAQGRVLAVRLEPDGVSYRGRAQTLLSGRPLPVTDLDFARDGTLLLTVGGRGAAGALLRVTGDGTATGASPGFTPAARPPPLDATTPLQDVVRMLDDTDRAVRYLAARELERRPPLDVDALLSTDPPLSTGAQAEVLVVRARQALAKADVPAAESLRRTASGLMAVEHPGATRRIAARALELLLLVGPPERLVLREPPPDPALGSTLLPFFPSGDPALDRELALLLARCEPAGAREALLAALEVEDADEEALHLLYALSALREPAPPRELRPALERLAVLRARPGGSSYQGYLDGLQRRLLEQAPQGERDALRALSGHATVPGLALVAGAPPRGLERTLAIVREAIEAPERSASEGAAVFGQLCAACHRRGDFGGAGGPDLGTLGARFALPELLAAVMQPSRDVSDQYRSTRLLLRDDGESLTLLSRSGETLELAAADVSERRLSALSAMPEGLLDGLSLRAVADLCAFLLDPAPPAAVPASAWSPLFADDLGGWAGDACWSARRGLLTATAASEPAVLRSPFETTDLAFECELRLPRGNAEIALRVADAGRGVVVELGGDDWGSLRQESAEGWRVDADELLVEPLLEREGWNHLLVEARGPLVRVALNGIECAARPDGSTASGRLELRLLPGAELAVRRAAMRRP